MKMILHKLRTIIHSNFFVRFLYYCLVLGFYINFLRLRLPRDIPFLLTDFRFFILLFIILMYFYIFYRLYFPKLPNEMIQSLLNLISKPFYFFHNYIFNIYYIYPYYSRYSENIIFKLKTLSSLDRIIALYKYTLFPRLLLVLIFATDVFYVNKIEIFYYFIFLGIFPLGYIYFKYLLRYIYNANIIYLETKYDSILLNEINNFEDMYFSDPEDKELLGSKHNPNAIYHGEFVSIRQYILINHERLQKYKPDDEKNNFRYDPKPVPHIHIYNEYKKKYNITNQRLITKDYIILHFVFNYLMPQIVILHNFFEVINKDEKNLKIKYIKSFIYLSYIICWSYILIKSYHTLSFPFAKLLLFLYGMLPALEEPFCCEMLISMLI